MDTSSALMGSSHSKVASGGHVITGGMSSTMLTGNVHVFVQGPTVTVTVSRKLPPQVLHGKQIFYDATDPRMNEDGYISCASCHLDGGHDGRVWDFTDRGEGLRNTTTLIGRRGLGHGNVHWTGNFDEIQDFEHDIRSTFGGDGFLTQAQWQAGTVSDPLGQPKEGLSAELDALAMASPLTSPR